MSTPELRKPGMLGSLATDLGDRTDRDAVSQCTRCGYCAQACPTYVATGREPFSARGRNQIVRLLLEGGLSDPQAAEEALSTCLLCGACTTVCPARVPTADLVLEGRRLLRGGKAPLLARALTHLLERRRGLLSFLLKWGYRFKRWGLAGAVARTGLLRLIGLRGLETASLHVDEAPSRFLEEDLEADPELRRAEGAQWAYLGTCGPNYLYPRVGRATVSVMKSLAGKGYRLGNPCCGLLPYNYGDLESARRLAKANIEAFESSGLAGDAPLIGDCSSCVSMAKSYPQLFLDDPAWRGRAEKFSSRVKDVIEAIPAEKIRAAKGAGPATYHDACRARNGQGIVSEPRGVMRSACGEAYRELEGADACCGGAGAFAFTHEALSDEVLRRKIGCIADTRARTVAVSSTSCLIQLAHGLKMYYPECEAVHLSELVARTLFPTENERDAGAA